MNMTVKKLCVLAAAQFAAAGTLAGAGSVLQIDINSMVADAGGAFGGVNHTGTIALSDDGTTSFASILINGVTQSAMPNLVNLSGAIDLVNGNVVGGSIAVAFADGSMYSANIAGGVGDVDTAADPGGAGPGPFTIDAMTDTGFFSNLVGGTHFGGVDVSMWDAAEPLIGSFLAFKFGPDANGFDSNADIDIFALATVIPLAPPVLLGLTGLGACGCVRRRMTA